MKSGIIVCLLVFAAFISGCSSTNKDKEQIASGSRKEKYSFGTYSAEFPCNLRSMDKAVRATCEKARLIELKRENSVNACCYEYKDINNIRLEINLKENKDGSVTIKIDADSKESSQLILIEIDNQLRNMGAL